MSPWYSSKSAWRIGVSTTYSLKWWLPIGLDEFTWFCLQINTITWDIKRGPPLPKFLEDLASKKKTSRLSQPKNGRFHLFHLNRLVGKKDTHSHLQIWPGSCCCSQDLQSRTQQNPDFLANWSMLITISGPSLYRGFRFKTSLICFSSHRQKIHTQTQLQTLHHTSRHISPFYTLNQDTEKTRRARCHSCDFSNALIIALKHCKIRLDGCIVASIPKNWWHVAIANHCH